MIALITSPSARAVELIANGGFETGDFTGWTASTNADGDSITELTPWAVGPLNNGWFGTSSPLSGEFDAFNGFDGDEGLVYELYQDVVIPADSNVTLTTNHRIVFDGFAIESFLDRIFEISIQSTSGGVLENLFSQSVTLNGTITTDLGWDNQVFDISAHAGSTVRVHFREFIPESYTGPANIELDDISLVAIPVPEPTALLMAGVALLVGTCCRRAKR